MSFRYRLVCMKHQTLGRVVPRLAQGHLYAGRPGHALRRQRENLKQPRVDLRRGVGYGACEYACTLQEDPAVYVTGIGESRSCAARSCLIASKGVRSVNLNSSQWMLAAATVAFLAAFAPSHLPYWDTRSTKSTRFRHRALSPAGKRPAIRAPLRPRICNNTSTAMPNSTSPPPSSPLRRSTTNVKASWRRLWMCVPWVAQMALARFSRPDRARMPRASN